LTSGKKTVGKCSPWHQTQGVANIQYGLTPMCGSHSDGRIVVSKEDSKKAIETLRKAKADLQDDITEVVGEMVKQFRKDTGVGIEAININMLDITVHGDLTRVLMVRDTEVELAL
jgi:hypothetical protein